MEPDTSVDTASSSVAVVVAKLEEARVAKAAVERAQQAWAQETGVLVRDQDAAIDALISELETCRSQLAMQKEAVTAIEVRNSSGTAHEPKPMPRTIGVRIVALFSERSIPMP
jgi:hypothetical protein